MPLLDNYEVWIRVDGKRLPEYGVHSDADPSVITCWIPSEAGKTFEICYKDSIRAFASGTRVLVDGNRCSGRILNSRQAKPHLPDTVAQDGITVSKDSYRPFVFSNCQLTDEDGFVSSSMDPGQITVDVDQLVIGSWKQDVNKYTPFPKPKVHERAKKGIVHGIQLGPESFRNPHKRWATTVIRRLATFKFKYRPLDVLLADGVAPRSAAPAQSNGKLDHNIGEARIQTMKEEPRQDQKKRKRNDSNPSLSKVKRDRSTLDNNIIDLT